MATYQEDTDAEKEQLVADLIQEEIHERHRRKPYRMVFLLNPLGTRTPQLDVFLAGPAVAHRVRVVHMDAGSYGTSHNITPSPSVGEDYLHHRHSASVADEVTGNAHRGLSRQMSSVSSAFSTSSSDSGRFLDPAAVVAEIVCLTKPALPRHLHWAATCALNALPEMEPGLSVLDVTGAEFRPKSKTPQPPHTPLSSVEPEPGANSRPHSEIDELDSSQEFANVPTPNTVVRALKDSPAAQSRQLAAGVVGASPLGSNPRETIDELTLPLNPLAERLSPAVSSAQSASPTASPDGRGQGVRVLLVEDNKVNISVAVKLLRLLSYEVDVCENGADAVAFIQRFHDAHHSPSVGGTSAGATASASGAGGGALHVDGVIAPQRVIILMDLHMPVMGGQEAADTIKALCRERGWPVPYIVAVTADALESTRAACLSSNFDDFLSKPFHLARLKQVLQRGIDLLRIAK